MRLIDFIYRQCFCLHSRSVAGPDPPDLYNFPGSGSVSKVGLDPESGSVSNDTDPDPTKTIENRK